jgi:hypothetical protein
MKLDHEEPTLTEPYLSKQKKLMVRLAAWHHQTDHRRSLKREKHYR